MVRRRRFSGSEQWGPCGECWQGTALGWALEPGQWPMEWGSAASGDIIVEAKKLKRMLMEEAKRKKKEKVKQEARQEQILYWPFTI